MSPFIAELIGTALLILLGNGVVANVVLKDTYAANGGWIVITTGWALAVFSGVVVAGPYSGAHLNPAVTVGLAIVGRFSWALVGTYIIAQMIGAMLGALLVWSFYRLHYRATESADDHKATFCTGPAIPHIGQNLWSELIGTFVLVFVVLFITGAQLDDGSNTPIGLGSVGAIPVAFLVWVIGLSLGGTTGYAINPARDLGPRMVYSFLFNSKNTDWSYAWIPVIGPLIGALVAGGLYLVL